MKKTNMKCADCGCEDEEQILIPPDTAPSYKADSDRRLIIIDDELCEETMEIAYILIEWNREDEEQDIPIEERQPIYIYLDSPGGMLDVAEAISTVVRLSETPVYMIGFGSVYSGAAYLLGTGQPGRRFIMPSANVMIHDGTLTIGGPTTVKTIRAFEFHKTAYLRPLAIFSECTGLPEDVLRQKAVDDWFMNADEAVECNIADKVITNICELF